jgi:hypothetical protein
MSELQKALLAIGLGVIVAVYLYGWWQQRRYRRKFGAAFKASHADALYQDVGIDPVGGPAVAALDITDLAVADPPNTLLDDSCALLNARSDFIIELRLAEPAPAAALDGLWQRKFDFRKPVQVCGQTLAAKKWERAIAESPVLYERFRIALQLVDRGGAISEAKLADFRDLVLGIAGPIKADATVPDIHETHRHAVELDAFCAEVDQMVGVNLLPPGNRMLPGRKVAQAAALRGMTLEADGAFHLLDALGHSLFSLINRDNEPFQHLSLDSFRTPGLTLLLDVPRVEEPASLFERMMQAARDLAAELQVRVVDDKHAEFSDAGLALIRNRIAEVEKKMLARGLTPGSAQACRLFS